MIKVKTYYLEDEHVDYYSEQDRWYKEFIQEMDCD